MTMFLPPDARMLSRPACEDWSALVQQRAGLAVREAQFPGLADLVQHRMRARGLATAHDYFELLSAESDAGVEWTEVVERLVSHETSFFRHPQSFEALRLRILPELRRRPREGRTLSLLSAGCSTGQEAYSLAMTAMADDPAANDFTVCGVDISRRAIETARLGRYSEKASALVPPIYRQRFMQARVRDGRTEFEVAPPVRARMRFLAMNLLTASDLLLTYDVIFCHNVLIYFAAEAAAALVSRLGARLGLGGYLVSGPGEAPIECPSGLEPVTLNGVRVFRRIGRMAREVRS